MECPCKDCKHRSVDCHSICWQYKQWCKENEEIRKQIRKAEQLERWRSKKL